jgi:hypothetical protein
VQHDNLEFKMKKLLFFILTALSLTANAIIYLVQQGGVTNQSWRTARSGEIVVNLAVEAKSFPAWYNASTTTFASGNQVWKSISVFAANRTSTNKCV